jgi:hypothetical protein
MPKYGTITSETHELFTAADVQRILATARTASEHFARPGATA